MAKGAEADRTIRVILALAALYLIWGTTYYGIRQAVQEIPPFTMAAIRYLIPGAAIYAWTRMRGVPAPGRAGWTRAAILGGLMLGIGNGAVTFAEKDMPSSIAALLVTAVPMWAVVLDWVLGGLRPRPLVFAGLGLGLAGVAVLSWKDTGGWTGAGFNPALMLLIICGSGAWAFGSLRSRKGAAPQSFWQDLAMQMLAGGLLLAMMGAAIGEPSQFHPSRVSATAWLWVAYLSLFGSVVALGCFLWLLRNTSAAVATTYAFVNPAVAVALAGALGDQKITTLILAASALIVTGVALIVAGKARKAPQPAPLPPPDA